MLNKCFFLMIRRPPRATRTDTLVPYTTLLRSVAYSGVWTKNHMKPMPITMPGKEKDRKLNVSSSAEAFVRTLRSEEHTSELQSLMRISYAVFCLKKKTYTQTYLPYVQNSTT